MNHLPFAKKHDANRKPEELIALFNACFASTENTKLLGNANEPIYQPANKDCQYNLVVFTRDYFSSALHEIAHWCIAGKQRRTLVDYGYWYLPDGRNAEQQARFEAAEVKPQALEYAFSLASGVKFRVSVDNLKGEDTCSKKFETAVENQLMHFIHSGFNARAQQFLDALHEFYGTARLQASFPLKNLTTTLECKVETTI